MFCLVLKCRCDDVIRCSVSVAKDYLILSALSYPFIVVL